MQGSTAALLLLSALAAVRCQSTAVPRFLGDIPFPYAAYVEAFQDDRAHGGLDYTLYVSTFDPTNLERDPKYYLRNPGPLLHNVSDWKFVQIDANNTAFWPNNPDYMPAEVAGAQGLVWTSGFVRPGKQAGALELYDTISDPPAGPFTITQQDTIEWAYHRVLWQDIDGDGDLDALTARFHLNASRAARTQLVWLENPGVQLSETPTSGWTQHVLQDSEIAGEKGPDVHFRTLQLTSGNVTFECLVASEFWREELALYYTSTGWANWTQVQRIPLDITVGQSFDVTVDDVNKDGRLDIVATSYNHSVGRVFVYEVPDDFRNGTFVRHTIADNFIPNPSPGTMSPGSPKTFYPSKAYEEELVDGRPRKPYIFVSGDDDGCHYILEPASEDPRNWTYTKHVLLDTQTNTVGKFAIADFDGDGYNEVVVAGFSIGRLYVYTYAP